MGMRWMVGSTLCAGLLLTGCGGSGDTAADEVVGISSAAVDTATPSAVPPVIPRRTPVPSPARTIRKARLQRALVGTWVTFGDSNAKQMYVFAADGTYTFTGVQEQTRPHGVFTFSVTADGTMVADGTNLILQPLHGLKSLRDPDAPSSNYDKPISTEQESYVWARTEDTLNLTDETGLTLQYARE